MRVLISDHNIIHSLLSGRSVMDYVEHSSGNVDVSFVFNTPCALYEALMGLGYDCCVIKHGTERSRILRAFRFFVAVFKLKKLIDNVRPDLVHANNLMAGRQVVLACMLAGVPSAVHIRNPYCPRRYSWVLDWCSSIFCVSEFVKSKVLSDEQKNKATIVYDGFDPLSSTQDGSVSRHASPETIIGLCSRVVPQKGMQLFCEVALAFSHREDVRFVHMGGEGSYGQQSSFEFELKKQYYSVVEWRTYSDSISAFYENIDILLFPAVDDEAFGRVVLEAMAFGVPCVSTRCGGPEEIIVDGVNGFLVDAALSEVYSALLQLIDNRILLRDFGRQAQADVKGGFSLRSYANRLDSAYRAMLP